MASRAIPSHLKPAAANGSGDGYTPRHHGKSQSHVAFENTSTNVAASQMRNALNKLCDTVTDPAEKKRFETEMDNFFALFRRYLNDKAKGNAIEWSRIAPPKAEQVVNYGDLANSESVEYLNKLAVVKLNGGLGTSMGCVGPKSVIEVRDGMSFLDLSVRQIEYLNRTYNVNVPFVLMNSFNTDADTANIIKKYEGHNIDIMTFNQSKYPRVLKDSLLPAPKSADSDIANWYPPGHGDVFESLYNSGILDKLIDRGIEIIFLSNADNLGAVVDLRILQHMVDSKSEYIMELTDKTKADVKGGTIIDYEGSVRLLEIAQVPKEHVNEFKSIKKFKYFNTNNIWMNLKAVKRVVENNELAMEIIPNGKSIPADKKGEADLSVLQLETAVGAAIRHFNNAHGVNVPRRRFLPVKTCSDLMLVKSDLYRLEHGQLVMDPNRFGPAPLIKLGSDFKKVSSFQARIPSIPKIVELDHLTITGAVNLGRGVTLKGTVIIVATEGSTIDIPPGSVLENVVVQGSLRLLEH
ncbi:UDP-glucose pyrophosphorylase [Delitschia confertaspora ATCC 74209]|uniref:UTP--glucose-1-phosphate uridylyltransferase n=1 Tax=Delitschia confertaspora ATCC 74209 TaxID=1513339 RepID=A0A9P4JII2_9PLEO|nr:UDP-glucose pyrophosphorylase [Delitschia confertaspora ATCC 74209]